MITHIIKRNGKLEEFSPSKVNGWGTWAAKTLNGHVDWGSVVLEAVNQCPAHCTSEQLQDTLISVCINRKTWEYNRMAGRLYADFLYKLFYPTGKPTIQELHQQLFDVGMMVKLNYSDEDYQEVEKIIDHKQDLKYPHYQINQIRTKYALRNKITKREYETPQFVYMRMAMALAENETENRLVHVQKWYEHFSHNRLNAPTPNFVNLGTKLNGYASCCLYSSDDTWQSLLAGDVIAYSMTCSSAGIGTHIKTRSLGDPIRGGLIEHQGKLPYYRAVVGMVAANLQNGRGGADTIHFTLYDPEVEVLQKLKHPMTPANKAIRGCHYSFGTNKFFARKVARNEDYYTFSYKDAPELYEAQYAKDQSIFEKLYAEYENKIDICGKGKLKLNARDVLLGSLNQSYETGVQYSHQTDTMNFHTPFKDTIYSSNLCLDGNTIVNIFHDNAHKSVNMIELNDLILAEEQVKVKSYDKNTGEITYEKILASAKTGVDKNVMKITDEKTGKYIICTPEHKIYTLNRGYIEAKNLKENDELLIL
jgi:ribonucleoside-diphosphate reductase alpha chain